MAKMFDYVKNIFWIILIIQLTPPLIKSIKQQYGTLFLPHTKVGLLTIKGIIYDSNRYVQDLRKFFENSDIKAIVIKMDSPGGVAGPAQTLFNEIKELKKSSPHKPVIAWVENMAASGGYYIVSAADFIVASPAAFIGSIGAYISHPALKAFLEQYKIKYDIIKAGEYKAAGSPFLDLTPAQREQFQGVIDNVYQQFINDVLSQRSKAKLSSNHKEWAEGKIFTGAQALALGLIDKTGSQSTVIEMLKAHAPITGKIEWVKPTHHTGLLQSLIRTDDDDDDAESGLSHICTTALKAVENRLTSSINY